MQYASCDYLGLVSLMFFEAKIENSSRNFKMDFIRLLQIGTFAIGVVMLVMSFVVVYFIDRKASVLFPSTPTI